MEDCCLELVFVPLRKWQAYGIIRRRRGKDLRGRYIKNKRKYVRGMIKKSYRRRRYRRRRW